MMACANYLCTIHGCQGHCRGYYQQRHYTVTVPYQWPVTQRGCICPPTSEQTCESPVCPRKAAAQGIETAKLPRREAGLARKGESPVAEGHAPESQPHD